ncbi:hypothetical protein EZV62_026604 [Acer yangbiense]|uniref:Integrase catalytic domain-containing protein n=1 Tax=Acer yangbiense TaxID=1000413 RepID=A0A5C7GRZ2_9ROSI|nr:hypothetical protein EZV62_026604 [Acer yangbiense]
MGGEYLPFVPYLSNLGVRVRFSCPYTHQQNGVPERKHRSIVEMGLTLLAHVNMPLKFWFEAFSTAVLLINNLPSVLMGFVSPFEKLFQKKPNYHFLKELFGTSLSDKASPSNSSGNSPLNLFQSFENRSDLDIPPIPTHLNTHGSRNLLSRPASSRLDGVVSIRPAAAADIIPSHTTLNMATDRTQNIHPMVTRGKTGSLKPKVFVTQCSFPTSFLTEVEPKSVKKLGADVCINYKTEDFVARVKEETGGKAAGLRSRSLENKAEIVSEVEKYVWPAITAGEVKPVILKYFPLSEAAEAHQLMESSQHIGKIMLVP